MPFVKKDVSKGPQSLLHARRSFIGRNAELYFFTENILKPEDPAYNIISISGQGGVGKSTLLTRLVAETHISEFNDYCFTALVDERQTTPVSVMEKFANQLHLAGEFKKVLNQYKEAIRKSQTDEEAVQDSVSRRMSDFAGAAAEIVPIVGPLLGEGVKHSSKYLSDKYHTSQISKTAKRLEDSVDDLTNAFVTELNRLANTQVTVSSYGVTHEGRIILFFDTFEKLANDIAPWLLDHFLATDISNNVVLVIAGRDSVERSTPKNPKRWLQYSDNNVIYSISLNNFTKEETQSYLMERAITDLAQINTIWQLSQGLPLYLSLLTSPFQGKLDPTKDVVENFLRWIPEHEQIKRRLTLDLALLSIPFNQDDLEAFNYVTEQDRSVLYQWLVDLPFVHTNPQHGRYSYHAQVKVLFSRHLYQQSRRGYFATRRALVDYYQTILAQTCLEGDKTVYGSVEWVKLTMALVYQLFLLPDKESHSRAIEQVLNVYEVTEQQHPEEIIRVLRELIQGQLDNHINYNVQQTVKLLLRYIEADVPSLSYFEADLSNEKQKEELLEATTALLKKVANEPSFSSILLAYIYRKQGFAFRNLKRYDLAIENYRDAIKLDPGYVRAYTSLGSAYRMSEKYELALENYKRALELEPDYAWAYAGRGETYRLLKKYKHAIQEISYAIDLSPNYAWAYVRRGLTYLCLSDTTNAHADYIRGWELDQTLVKAYWMARWTEMCYRRIDHKMLTELEAITKVYPRHYVAHVCRGITLWIYQHFIESLEQLELAIFSRPEESDAYFWKGMACIFLERNEEASVALKKALSLGLPSVLLSPLLWLEQDKPESYIKVAVPLLEDHGML